MELVKFIHDFTITGAMIVIALLPRLVAALADAKASGENKQKKGSNHERFYPCLFGSSPVG